VACGRGGGGGGGGGGSVPEAGAVLDVHALGGDRVARNLRRAGAAAEARPQAGEVLRAEAERLAVHGCDLVHGRELLVVVHHHLLLIVAAATATAGIRRRRRDGLALGPAVITAAATAAAAATDPRRLLQCQRGHGVRRRRHGRVGRRDGKQAGIGGGLLASRLGATGGGGSGGGLANRLGDVGGGVTARALRGRHGARDAIPALRTCAPSHGCLSGNELVERVRWRCHECRGGGGASAHLVVARAPAGASATGASASATGAKVHRGHAAAAHLAFS
jgi:hypothetical protein